MGMAASQARFLGLTARKTNVEYEGQQINQQRTMLSNTTANYYNDLLGMAVPVPPSIDDYTKTVYSFKDGALTNAISSMIAQSNGLYKVSYTSSWVDDFSAVGAPTSIVTKDSGNYMVGAKTLRILNTTIPEDLRNSDDYYKTLSDDQVEKLMAEESAYAEILSAEYGGDPSDWMVRYVENTTMGTFQPFFCKKSVLDAAIYSDSGSSLSYIAMYTIGSKEKTEEVKQIDARFEQDSTGRIINVTLHPGELDEVTYAVQTQTVTDQAKYDDAMNQYEFDKAQYQQTVQEINAKIEIIQTEDRNLELRLKQLDTEQEAIQTEMDAVQKVIEKNTESTFKTFG